MVTHSKMRTSGTRENSAADHGLLPPRLTTSVQWYPALLYTQAEAIPVAT